MIDPARGRCRDPDQRGFTLVEVMVATMISAMMVTGFFSIALTSRVQTNRADHKLAANQNIQRVLQKLKNYVADPAKYDEVGAFIRLPNGGKISQDTSGQYALAVSVEHDVTNMLKDDTAFYNSTTATWKVADPPKTYLKYCVANPGVGYNCGSDFGTDVCPAGTGNYKGRCVKVIVAWEERGI